MRKIIVLLSVVISSAVSAQDIYFLNPQQSLVNLNPSFAGSNGFIRNQTNLRTGQFGQVDEQYYMSIGNSFDMFFKRINGGVAVNYLHDDVNSGLLKNDVFNITYAQYFYLKEKQIKIIPSVQLGGFVRHLNRSKITFEDMRSQFDRNAFVRSWDYEPVPRKSNLDFSTGLLVQYKKLFIGASLFHFTQPDMGLWGVSKLPFRFNAHASYSIITKRDLLFNFSAMCAKQGYAEYAQIMAKVLLFKHAIVGLGCENRRGYMGNIGYRTNYYSINLTATYKKNGLGPPFSSELGFSYTLRNKDQRKQLTCMENW
ncbi:MAG: type IX secretion system membrane protein PorP/SprF [Sphingobacteriaceae bacterium]|nr:type IX secretion system membrane protein PorP/SprF [Sphingobacteriaceae bacterium]